MGLSVVKKENKKPSIKRTVQTSPIDFMILPRDARVRRDAEILIQAAEIKQDSARYRAAKKLIKGAVEI